MKKQKFSVPSSDGIHTLSGVVYLPEDKPCGYVQIVHGMSEHIGRYDPLMTSLCEAGYLVFGHDHLGHGNTARGKEELGFIASCGGYDLLAKDVGAFFRGVKKEYPHKIPHVLFGHSMGSFVVRRAVAEGFSEPDKLIVMGTGGRNPAAGAGLLVTSLMKLFCGEKHISHLLYALAFGSYNKRFGGGTPEDPSPWLTRDEEQRKKNYADPFCTFRFTASAMGDLIYLNKITNEKEWFRKMPKTLPILLLSGEEDPVGDYGKGVLWVEEECRKAGLSARAVLYPDARHEILNDSTFEEVKNEILAFLSF